MYDKMYKIYNEVKNSMKLKRKPSVFKMAVAVFILLLMAISGPIPADAVVSGHPRIYIRPQEIGALRTRVTQAPISTFYNQLRSRMDNTSTRSSNHEVAGFELESLALMHLVAGGTTYRDKIMNTWRFTSYSLGQVNHWALPYQVMGHAIALDWLWNDLSVAQRGEIGRTIVSMMDELYNYAPYNTTWPNQMSDYSNQLYYHLGALAFAGIVLAGEGINDSRAQFYLSEAEILLRDHMIPAMNQEAGGDSELRLRSGFSGNGGWGEDMGHIDMTHPLFGRMVEAWRTGMGQDLFPEINGLAKISKYIAYLRRPNGMLSPKGNGTYQIGMSDKNYGTLGSLLSVRYNDPLGKFIKDTTYQGTTYGFHQLGPVIWYNQSVPSPNFSAMPKAVHFQGQGEVIMRSGFGPQDTWVYLRSGPIYNGHQHDDQGNLLIEAYGGEILIENAGIDVNHETVYHNSIRIAGSDQIPYGNNAIQSAQLLAGTQYERGRVTSVQTYPLYTYVATDFGAAYPDSVVVSPKSGKVTREIVTILPDIIIVRDRVAANGMIDVLFHTWAGTGSVNSSARELRVNHRTGHGWLKTVFPTNATFRMAPQSSTDLLTVGATGTGSHIEFIHVVYLSPSSSIFIPSEVIPISNSLQTGVSLRDRTGQIWSVAFRSEGVGLSSVINDGNSIHPSPPASVR